MKELNEAKVLAVGPGAFDKDGKRLPMGVKSGDKVLIPQVRSGDIPSDMDKKLMLDTVRRQPYQGWRG